MLKLDLQFFAEGEDDSLDFETMLADFENEWNDEEESVEEDDTKTAESAETPTDADDETEVEETPKEETVNPNDPDAEKRNKAFAELRRQAEENRKYAEFIQKLAEEGGVTPDDLLSRYEERRLQAEAEKQNIPVEFLKESRETSARLSQLEEQLRAERLESQIQSTISKYNASEDAVKNTFDYMFQAGIDPRVVDNVDFEKMYRAANLDSIIQQETEKAVQKNLEDKKKRQESASIGNGQSVSPSSEGDWSDDDFNAELERLGLRI